MDLKDDLERKSLGVTVKRHLIGAYFFADDGQPQNKTYRQCGSNLWSKVENQMQFKKKCGMLMVGQKRQTACGDDRMTNQGGK